MAEFSVVGKRLPRVDARSKVTGKAVFSADVSLPNMLHGKILRSPYAHATIKRLDTSRAQALAGVKGIITAADVPGYRNKSLLPLAELPRLARGKVVYTDQPIAVVAAETASIAEQALDLIDVEYEELPAVFDALEAMKPDALLIHDDLYTNSLTDPESGESDRPCNIAYHININKGDPEAGFREADIVLENTFRTQKVHQGYLEPFAAVADVDASGKVTIWTQSQGIFMARQMLAEFLALPLSMVRVVQVEIGGAFGGKTYLPVAPFCALLAMKTGRPVRMEISRDEVLKDSRPAPEAVVTLKMGATSKGQITAASINLVYDGGAFPEMSHAMFTTMNVLSQYRIPNVKIETRDVMTNKLPSAFYRSPGTPQAHFAVESTVDMLARALGMDSLQLRILNAAVEGDTMPNGTALPRVGFREALEKMADYLKDKDKPAGRNQGRGVACGFWHGGNGAFGANIIVNGDGSVNLVMGVTDISGSRTSLAQIAAEELGLSLDRVNAISADTETAPWATMSVGSMTLHAMSAAVYQACQDVKAQLGSRAAARMGVDASEIEFSGGFFRVRGDPGKSISFADIAKSTTAMMGGTGPVTGHGSTAGVPFAPTLSVHAVDLEVDVETGKVKVLSYAVAQDVGRAINPLSIEGQMQGAVTQGIGWALMEGYIFNKGAVQNTTLLDYRLPTATDVPMIDTMIVEVGSSKGIYGLRHVGEPPMVPTLAAVANAIYDATGVRPKETPMNPEALLKGIKQQAKS